jgi:hypothetical protein
MRAETGWEPAGTLASAAAVFAFACGLAAGSGSASAEEAAIAWVQGFQAAQGEAQKTGKPIAAFPNDPTDPRATEYFKKMEGDAKTVEIAKRFVMAKLPLTDPRVVAAKLNRYVLSHLFFDSAGESLDKPDGLLRPEDIGAYMENVLAKHDKKVVAQIEKILENKGVGDAAAAAALTRVGTLKTNNAASILADWAKREKAGPSARKAAIVGLGHQASMAADPKAAQTIIEDLLPFLGDKSPALRTAAVEALKVSGPAAAAPALTGLENESADYRANCFTIAQAVTKFPKAKSQIFWRDKDNKNADERKKLLDEWKAWWEMNKPAEVKTQ